MTVIDFRKRLARVEDREAARHPALTLYTFGDADRGRRLERLAAEGLYTPGQPFTEIRPTFLHPADETL